MKKEMIKKLLTTAMVGVFVINGFTITKVDAVMETNNKVEVAIPNLNPTPESLEIKGGNLTLTSTVNIKGADVADVDAMRILTEFLSENDIVINEIYNEDSTTLIIGEVDDEVVGMESAKKRLGVANTADLKEEGYVLATDADDTEYGTILIEGKDGDGTFYGVKTLTQLAVKSENKLSTAEVVISDEPTMKTRGVIEGFYGSPWTNQDRLNQVEFYGDNKMNTYIYAPKDDPYHRVNWRQPYPQSEMARMSELIKTSHENKVDFVFAISPGIDIRFDGDAGEEDFQALMNKCESLYEMGVRSFAIYYDDINDKSAVKQANLLNRFNKEFVKAKGDVKPLITVPTEYDTGAMVSNGQAKSYTRDFAATVDKDIEVMWTGKDVVTEGISVEDVRLVNDIYGKKLAVWWNYPVTDYMKSKLALGPIYNLDKGLSEEIDFFTMNPMEHADLSRITLATGADYSWNTSDYDYNESWNNAIEMLFGDLATEMKVFANHSTRMDATWGVGREDAPEVRETMDRLWNKLIENKDVESEIKYLYQEFDNMVKAADKLKAELPSGILEECNSNLSKLKLLGENCKLALDFTIAQREQNKEEASKIKDLINSNMESLTSGSRVSEKTALAFINEALTYDPYPQASFNISDTLVAPGQEITLTNTSSSVTEEIEWIFEGANIENSTEQNPTISYEKEGIYSVILKGKNILGEDVEVKEGLITVTNEMIEGKVNLALGKTATASSYVATSEAPKYAIDGNGRTKWCAVGNTTHTITIDLGEISIISDVVLRHAESGKEPAGLNTSAYTIETSEDGENFKELVKVKGNKDGVTSHPVKVIKSRYVRLKVDKPTQGDDNAARIYEIEVMGLEGDVKLPPVYEKPEIPEEIIVSKPSNLEAGEVTSNTVALSWNAPENTTGLVGYEIYKDGKILTEVDSTNTNYIVEGLRANTNYGFKVISKYSNDEKSKPVSINIRTKKK
ncbi:MAG: beta-N-acetylglucosaminidase domain-containing protein [Clostridium sp.]